MDTNNTHESPGTLHGESIRLQDVHDRTQRLVGTLTVYVDQQFIAAPVLPSWITGLHHFDAHSSQTPEHRGPQRLASLWLLDALIKSPDALIEAMIEARTQLVAAGEALQPSAPK